jgi:hypothetical protein
MRWAVKITGMTGDEILADVLAALGFALNGDMLSGEEFETYEHWGDVSDAAQELAHNVREVARLNRDIEISFNAGAVHESSDGEEVHVHNKIYAKAAAIALRAAFSGVGTVTSSLSAEEKAEMKRKARLSRAAELVQAVRHSELVLTVMRLLDGEPGTLELGHVHDLILNDMGGNLSAFASRNELTRFTRSINHPEVLGLKARHAVTKQEPPPNPMTFDEATRFIGMVSQKWINAKAADSLNATRCK